MLEMCLALIAEENDREKFTHLYNTYYDMMYRIAMSILHNKALADETVQDCLFKLAETITEVPKIPSKKAKSKIVVMTKNKAVNNFKLEHYQDVEQLDEDDYISDKAVNEVVTGLGYKKILQEILAMDDIYRDILVLYFVNGISTEKISELLQIPTRTVETRIYRGRKDRIKKFMRGCTKAVVSLAAVFGIFFGVLLTQPSVFAAVQNVFRSVFDKYDKYEFVGEELTIENFDNSFRLGYMPDGYYLSEGNYSRMSVNLTYKNEDKNIKFKYGIAESLSAYYDNEHNSYEKFYLNGIEYHYYESNNGDFYDTLIWYDSGYDFSILANLPKDELIKMAENIEK